MTDDSLPLDIICEFHGPFSREKMICPSCRRELEKTTRENQKEATREG